MGRRCSKLDRIACHGLVPDLTICIDIDTETGLARALARGEPAAKQRLEEQAIEFHHKVREAYHELARREPQRFRLIDGRGTPEAIAAKVWEEVASSPHINSMRSLRAEYSISFSSRLICVSSLFALATHPAVMRR